MDTISFLEGIRRFHSYPASECLGIREIESTLAISWFLCEPKDTLEARAQVSPLSPAVAYSALIW